MTEWAKQVVNDLGKELEDDQNPLTRDMNACGDHILAGFRAVVLGMTTEEGNKAPDILDDLARAAYLKLSTAQPASLTICWRRLYTDVKIFRALAILLHSKVSPDVAKVCVAELDHAIVTAGPCGEGRLELILGLIGETQSRYLQDPSPNISGHLHILSHLPPPASATVVPRFERPPSFASFITTHSGGPFVISGYARSWPAVQNWGSVQYLLSVSGPGRIVPVEVGSDYRDTGWTQRMMSWDDFLEVLFVHAPGGRKNVLYLAQHNLFNQFPSLRNDVVIPDYVYASLPAPKDFPGYRPPSNEDQLVINVWLGPEHTISPAHTDPYYNFYTQVVGRKTIWLAPPSASPYMYPYPNTSTDIHHHHNPAANSTIPSMSNTSRVNVFGRAGEDDFADFWKCAVPQSMSVNLEPGDVLFFPPGWWHAMRSEETSFSVSMWF